MCLLEKAWAKLHGCYSLIESGRAENVFNHLTNAATQIIGHRNDKLVREEFWYSLINASEMSFPMTCGTPNI